MRRHATIQSGRNVPPLRIAPGCRLPVRSSDGLKLSIHIAVNSRASPTGILPIFRILRRRTQHHQTSPIKNQSHYLFVNAM